MTAKEQKIKDAWIAEIGEENWNQLYLVDDNGFSNWTCRRLMPPAKWDNLYSRIYNPNNRKNTTGNDLIYRPLSLQGIEDNRGWNRIDEVGLPNGHEVYFISDGNRVDVFTGNLNALTGSYTHYQIVEKPQPPLY